MHITIDSCINEVLSKYFSEPVLNYHSYGNGHINDTFLVETENGKYVLQRMNTSVFKNPGALMQNIVGVTEHIRRKVLTLGMDPAKATVSVVLTFDGASFCTDSLGGCWRLLEYTDSSFTLEQVSSPRDFYNCAKAFGTFQELLSDYPAHTLHNTIENFHNTPWRYGNLAAAVEKDACGRVADVLPEIEFARERREFCQTLERAFESGKMPLRVTHNDTKLNNVLFNVNTKEPICVVDLDTVMPGYSVNDFGDAIRFGANTAVEDETDLSKVSLDLTLFEAFAKGFLESCGDSLTDAEIGLLPVGAMMMTLECGMRFLTDHIEGDTYFKIHRPGHNLDRARCQFALVADMERKLDDMNAIINKIR